MSRLMIQTFFPVNLDKAESFWLGSFLLNDVLFPPSTAKLCPEVAVTIADGITIRQPALAVSATLGVLVGFKGGFDLWRLAKRNGGVDVDVQDHPHRRQAIQLWALAFMAFGMMNVSALPLHCLLAAPETTYPQENPLWWSIDTYMTGASSTCLCMAAWEECQPLVLKLLSQVQRQLQIQSLCRRAGLFLHAIGWGCLMWFWMAPRDWQQAATLGLEDWYLFPPLIAGLPVFLFLYDTRDLIQQWDVLGHALFGFGVLLATGSILMDRPFCHWLGTSFGDVFTSSNGMFFACDLCFLGLYIVLWRGAGDERVNSSTSATKKVR